MVCNFRVRNGNGCGPCSMIQTRKNKACRRPTLQSTSGDRSQASVFANICSRFQEANRTFDHPNYIDESIIKNHNMVKPHGRLVLVSSTLLHLHFQPINLIVRTAFNVLNPGTEQPAKPLGPAPAPGCDEPTSRCQTAPSM